MLVLSDPAVAAVPVWECGEDLADVRDHPDLLLDCRKRDSAGAWALLRSSVLTRLLRAQRALPAGLRLLVIEGYRPATLQRHYFQQHQADLVATYPQWPPGRVETEASKHVAPPAVAPHPRGAAIDVTLATADGAELDLGTPVDATPEQSASACFTAAENISANARANREILLNRLTETGLVNYPPEWWHYSYGDPYWAATTGAPHAIYAPQ